MTKMSDRHQENQRIRGLKEKFNELKKSIDNNLTKLSESSNDILMDDVYHLVDYVAYMRSDLEKIISYRDIYILEFFDLKIKNILSNVSNDDFVKVEVLNIKSLLNNYQNISQEFIEKLNDYLDDIYQDAWLQVENFSKLNDIYKNHKTYEIYKKSEDENHKKYIYYIIIAISFAIFGLFFSIFGKAIYTQCFFAPLCILEYNDIDYWIMKAGIIFITITGVTFCLKQAIHHQKKKDKAEQTRLELEALPTYMFNFSDEQKNEVYKELTGKYFGRDFDNEGYKDMANLIQEQIRLSHEVLKDTLLKNSNATSTKKVS